MSDHHHHSNGSGLSDKDLFETRCLSQYLQSKIPTNYDSLKQSLRDATDKKNSSKIQTSLQNLTYYKVEKDILDTLLSIISMTDDKKILKLAYYFLVEISAYRTQINNSAEIKNMITIFTKEMNHKDISRKVVSLKTTAMLAPNDSLVDSNIMEVISGILRKVGEDPDKVQKKKGFFSKVSDLGRERALLQYACFVACRNRFKNNPSLFMPIVEGIKCTDQVGARHAVQLTLDYAKENVSTVAATIKRFLPLLKANKGKEAVALIDPFARRSFIALCGLIAKQSSPADSKDFFQNICQSVMDSHTAVWCCAINTLCKFPWKTLESGTIEPISTTDNDTPSYYDPIGNVTPLLVGISNRIKTGFAVHISSHATQQSVPFTHMACKLINSLSQSYVKHQYPKDAAQNPQVGVWTELEKSDPKMPVHPFAGLTAAVTSLLQISPNISIRVQALRALVWLCPSSLCPAARAFFDIFKAQLYEPGHPILLFRELFGELYKRIVETPILSPFLLQLVYDWIDIVPHKVDTSLVRQIWETILNFGLEGRERVLQNCFSVMDRSIHPDFRVVSLEILKDIVFFLGDYANVITYENQNNSTTLAVTDNQALNSIILRLEQYAIFHPWQIRMTAIDALAKIAFLSSSAVRIHIYHFLTTSPNDSHGWTSVKSNNSTIINIIDQLLTLRSKWLPLLKTINPTQKKELINDHNSLTLQIGMFFDSPPTDYYPIGIETKQLVI
ncbi:hypothetical protein PPL_07013 [Heterostelium album PN500]|uniref:Uncharacterized protein n=1 Tax=Heterostelium pallidum (strain ATCC 26659 / Pp 5 / PN500) TaxID=670386 RepID=D3BE60_HETP5|nr:hypothetical protein PPL_07013 [Heterostelium album PN500]EFA80191.1 hypothetical protein PPL_07013 [Heterostelium album PN500]|eukprot:XP_020432311.1 hypothetical protein PPL_07013 [Heterostelium album PN500]